jgi:hypothetical protein
VHAIGPGLEEGGLAAIEGGRRGDDGGRIELDIELLEARR